MSGCASTFDHNRRTYTWIDRSQCRFTSSENGCHGLLIDLIYIATLVMLEQLFKLLNYIILVTDGLVETFDVTFLMFRHLVGVGILLSDLETPGIVTQWIVAGE